MTLIQKLMRAFGFDVSDEQAELIETAMETKSVKTTEDLKGKETDTKVEDTKVEETKTDSKDSKGGDSKTELEALKTELAAIKASLEASKHNQKLDSLLVDSNSKDKDLLKSLLHDSATPEADIKALKETKSYLFNELPSVTGSEEQKSLTEFEKLYNETKLK